MFRQSRLLLLAFAVIVASLQSAAQQASTARSNQTRVGGANDPATLAERIQQVENGFEIPLGDKAAPFRFDLHWLMRTLRDPGLSIAVIDNYKIDWAKGYGVTELGKTDPVNPKTLFQAGSISKPVAAAGALYLVERRKLSLDEDVNKRVVSWKVPDNEFTKDQKVTLRRILSHSAGLTVHGFSGYAPGEPLPTLVQVLNGGTPANNEPVRVTFVPGSRYLYSGGGVTIEQLLITEVTKKPFPQFMRETVLDKIGMTDSTFEQPLPAKLATSAATGTYSNDPGGPRIVPGRWHIYPEMAAAGLWTTPTDLAQFAIEIALSREGKADHVLSQRMTREMLTPQIPQMPIAHMGLGLRLGDKTHPDIFFHDGGNKGFQALFVMVGGSGQGVVVMANSDNGYRLAGFVIASVAKAYGWSYDPYRQPIGDVLWLVRAAKGTEAAIEEYRYLKEAALFHFVLNGYHTLDQLGRELLLQNQISDAIAVMKLNVQEYPQSWNVYNSLGDAYMQAGQRESAIQNYQKSLELNPGNKNAIDKLGKLKD